MKRFMYWIRHCLIRNDRSCRHFCVLCPHYNDCREDDE